MKSITKTVRALKGAFALALTLALVPLASVFHPAEAKPPRHAPAYGYRAKQRNSANNYRRYQPRRSQTRRPTRRPYPTRTYRRTPTRPYGSSYNYNRRPNRAPSGSTRNRPNQRDYRRDRNR